MTLTQKDLLGLENLPQQDMELILDTAESMKEIIYRPIKKVPTLRGKTVINMFFEPSTRTRTSFELAAKYLSADTINISASSSSVVKGESLRDTFDTIQAMGADAVVLRHSMAGSPHIIAPNLPASIINAGDGTHEHPTQGLLDMLTVRQKLNKFARLKIAIVGDILHSRVARSDIWGFTRMGAEVWVCGPPALMAPEIDRMGVRVTANMREALEDADVIIMLRLQLERQQQGLFPSVAEYAALFGLNRQKLAWAKPHALVMHPGPINRGVEIVPEVADSLQSEINNQVTNGLAVRMAVLYLMLGGGH